MDTRTTITTIISSVDLVVEALCRDYDRRVAAIKQKRLSRRTEVELKYINFKMLEAAREIVGDLAEIYIIEIGKRRGYAKSKIECESETSYKNKKQEVKRNIAKKLHLCD